MRRARAQLVRFGSSSSSVLGVSLVLYRLTDRPTIRLAGRIVQCRISPGPSCSCARSSRPICPSRLGFGSPHLALPLPYSSDLEPSESAERRRLKQPPSCSAAQADGWSVDRAKAPFLARSREKPDERKKRDGGSRLVPAPPIRLANRSAQLSSSAANTRRKDPMSPPFLSKRSFNRLPRRRLKTRPSRPSHPLPARPQQQPSLLAGEPSQPASLRAPLSARPCPRPLQRARQPSSLPFWRASGRLCRHRRQRR